MQSWQYSPTLKKATEVLVCRDTNKSLHAIGRLRKCTEKATGKKESGTQQQH